jgi:hypothetical protein
MSSIIIHARAGLLHDGWHQLEYEHGAALRCLSTLDCRADPPSITNLKSLLVTLNARDVKLSTARTVQRVGRRAVPTLIEALTSSDDEVFAA